jgi:hypothetical protein
MDAERDVLRLVAEAHLKEFDFLRREIELRLQQRERMMTYFFLLAGTALASQVLLEQFSVVGRFLQNNPGCYLILGFVLLWFPVETVMSFSYMRHMGRYINDVLSPKLTRLSEAASAQTPHGVAYIAWQQASLSPQLRGQLRWEAYLREVRPYAYPYFGLSVFALLRTLILFGPSAFCVFAYADLRLDSLRQAWWLLALESLIVVAIGYIIVNAAVRTIGSR